MERLDKLIASQGMLTRKEAKALIFKGKVHVNGEVVRAIDFKVDGEIDEIEINGNNIGYKRNLYLMMNKPSGSISSTSDPNAETVLDLLPEEFRRKKLFPAGRLDKDTEGLLIITDDGQFAHKMLAPKSGVWKVYHAKLDGQITSEDAARFEKGIEIDGGEVCRPAKIRALESMDFQMVEIKISEGKYHQVKRMAQAIGREVLYLRRVSIGGLCLDETLPLGGVRELTKDEIDILLKKTDS